MSRSKIELCTVGEVGEVGYCGSFEVPLLGRPRILTSGGWPRLQARAVGLATVPSRACCATVAHSSLMDLVASASRTREKSRLGYVLAPLRISQPPPIHKVLDDLRRAPLFCDLQLSTCFIFVFRVTGDGILIQRPLASNRSRWRFVNSKPPSTIATIKVCSKRRASVRPVLADRKPDAFQEFLKGFKTSPEHTIATAMGNITIDEDDLSDEYDFMDEDDDTGERRRQEKEQRRSPQYKYKQLLQELANRTIDEITIDLDDVATVCLPFLALKTGTDNLTVGERQRRKYEACRLYRTEHQTLRRYYVESRR